MLALLVVAWGAFGWSASRRWKLLRAGQPVARFDQIGERLRGTWRWAFKQERMDYYQPSGIAHKLIFVGFMVLLLRTLILWGRGFSPSFDMFVLAPWMPAGRVYEFAKDCVATLVVGGTGVFFYYRLVKPLKRTTLSFEAILILAIIATMMIADMAYDGASHVLLTRKVEFCGMGKASLATAGQCDAIRTIVAPLGEQVEPGMASKIEWSPYPAPAGTLFAVMFRGLGAGALVFLAHLGFWTHSTLVLLFLNLLPHSKHFHVITGIPNVFFRSLEKPGRLMSDRGEHRRSSWRRCEAEVTEAGDDPAAAPIGISRMEHFSWKAILDFYTCTECGRCSDNCPAHKTGKILSPKHLTLDLRNNLYHREKEFTSGEKHPPINLAPDLIHPDVLWACTTCRACEEQCPVFISYVDKIVDMRRNLMMIRNEFPNELGKVFQGMETNGNPWNVSRMDRTAWTEGLDVPLMSDKPNAEVLYWVGCAAATDPRARKIARAVAKLLKQAEGRLRHPRHRGELHGRSRASRRKRAPLRRRSPKQNVATLNGYKEKGGMKTVVTACPHCFNTLKNEYPDFGAKLEVVHHTDFLLGLLAEKKLVPVNEVSGRVTYHDSCYLGRYNGVYDSPREILKRIGIELVEPAYWTKQRGLCCGAGGAQMFMEEQNKNRVNVKRTLQLVDTGAKTIASACPFCMTMLTDGLKSESLEEEIKQMDVAELLEQACAEKVEDKPAPPPVPEAPAPAEEVAPTA